VGDKIPANGYAKKDEKKTVAGLYNLHSHILDNSKP
jgi:hypothetical protein